MGECRDRTRLALEARVRIHTLHPLLVKNLDRDFSPQPRVAGPPHFTHAPGANASDNLVGAELRSDLNHDSDDMRSADPLHQEGVCSAHTKETPGTERNRGSEAPRNRGTEAPRHYGGGVSESNQPFDASAPKQRF